MSDQRTIGSDFDISDEETVQSYFYNPAVKDGEMGLGMFDASLHTNSCRFILCFGTQHHRYSGESTAIFFLYSSYLSVPFLE